MAIKSTQKHPKILFSTLDSTLFRGVALVLQGKSKTSIQFGLNRGFAKR
jgi:hypothetical protein